MPQTNLQVITASFVMLGILSEGNQPSPSQTARGMEVLNDHLLTQQRDGWRLGWYPQTLANVNSAAPLKDEDIGDIKLVLAEQLAPWYTVKISEDPDLRQNIDDAKTRLNKRYVRAFESDLGELQRPQGGPWGGPNFL